MNKFKSALIKTGKFLRKNVYYVVIVVAVAAICAIVGVTVSKTKQAKNSTPVVNDTNIESPQDKPADKPDPVCGCDNDHNTQNAAWTKRRSDPLERRNSKEI